MAIISSSSSSDHRKASCSSSSLSSSSSFVISRSIQRPSSSSTSSSAPASVSSCFRESGARSMTPSHCRSNGLMYQASNASVEMDLADETTGESFDAPKLGDSISVCVRFRPLSEREFLRGDEIAWYADGDKVVRSEYNPATAYAFDRVFGPSTTSDTVYDTAASPVIKASMEGVNGTVFAYGVTSSGKTHTMHGDQNSPGIIPLAIKDVFSIIQESPGREFLLRMSYLEIYNEVINDLLDPTGQNLRVREDSQGTYVEGIKEEVVLSPGHALSFIAAGEEHRHVGSNNFNLFSSRSHTIFTLMIESSARGDEYDGVVFSQLNLIDLAGSESSKTETTGLRRKEGSYINKSLLTLGTVIGKLSEGKASHVPYRDSKLTRLLQSSLSGHGHVSLICTVTPASSNMEETHSTLKFASRAKRVEIFASCNRIIDEKSLIKKYQREISSLKQELDQLKKGMRSGVSNEEVISLRQKLEEGQVKMQSRLEEEEEAKAALMSRIQRLTKLILVSTKNNFPVSLKDLPTQQIRHSHGDDLDGTCENENKKDTTASVQSDHPSEDQGRKSSGRWSEEQSSASLSDTESMLLDKVTSQITSPSTLSVAAMTSDEMDLLGEQVKMLAGEIAFATSTLKRLVEQSKDDPCSSQSQIQKLECEIQEKRRQMMVLEQRIVENGKASVANTSLVDMQQTITRLAAQCNEKDFELEIKSADNRILEEQLKNKHSENKELEEKVLLLKQQLTAAMGERSTKCSGQCIAGDYLNELNMRIQSQEIEIEKLRLEHIKLLEKNDGLHLEKQKLAEEASYAKELASDAAVELKNLAGEITKLSLDNDRLAKELLASQVMTFSLSVGTKNNSNKYSATKCCNSNLERTVQLASSHCEEISAVRDNTDHWNLDSKEILKELQAGKHREAALEAVLTEKELSEEHYRRKFDESKKREADLENDLASMWVLVAKLRKEGASITEVKVNERSCNGAFLANDVKPNEDEYQTTVLKEMQPPEGMQKTNNGSELEPLVVSLKARIQEMKEKQLESRKEDVNPHVCKVCFEMPTAALLLPCRHFSLCKPCSLACSECPICRSKIEDRIFAFPS
ncbi:hypothetical protein Syun_015598 [Stephania yunnanensis]|uniref:Uncharacterized protein n=1 Tax=Stephania yunnanensis TaxID=152371 RepID=A0AAP0P9I0_9MAGN